jgi:diaminopimelate epimerase
VIDAQDVSGCNLNELSLALCSRRESIGSDGMLVLGETNEPHRLRFRMFNPDGTEDMCGNGMRCAVLWAARKGIIHPGASLILEGFDRDRTCSLESVAIDRKSAVVTVDMGIPNFAKAAIPFVGPVDTDTVLEYELPLPDRNIVISAINTGSTHAVSFLKEPLSESDFARLSPLVERHPYFPEQTSIMWAVQESESSYRIRIWERGASETLGCGTGETAVAVIAWKLGLTNKSLPVKVISKGGILKFTPQPDDSVRMTGPSNWVFSGNIPSPRK